jgi:hypothetical protein
MCLKNMEKCISHDTFHALPGPQSIPAVPPGQAAQSFPCFSLPGNPALGLTWGEMMECGLCCGCRAGIKKPAFSIC